MQQNEEVISAQKQSWDKFSGGWKKWDLFIQNWMGPVGKAIIDKASLKQGDRVIDSATGTGEPGLSAAKYVGSEGAVAGTDVSEEMVRIAQENAKAQGITNYSAVVAATSALPFNDNSFDAAISRFGVIFAPDVSADIKELMRVVKSGGKISVGAWAEPIKNQWATIIPKIFQEITKTTPSSANAPGVFRCSQPDSLPTIMAEAGLRDVNKIEVTGEFIADSLQQYWDIMLDIAAPIVGALSKVDESVRREVYKKTLEVLHSNFMKGERVVIPWSAWVVCGTK
ncbi:MAG: class I SAM-dependent methyltransferase [Candidatus Vogelbacteria bacterium]|nr:class I SAM-dependent methyltransferase [Candidatus Vogelbacteria bacterium]